MGCMGTSRSSDLDFDCFLLGDFDCRPYREICNNDLRRPAHDRRGHEPFHGARSTDDLGHRIFGAAVCTHVPKPILQSRTSFWAVEIEPIIFGLPSFSIETLIARRILLSQTRIPNWQFCPISSRLSYVFLDFGIPNRNLIAMMALSNRRTKQARKDLACPQGSNWASEGTEK